MEILGFPRSLDERKEGNKSKGIISRSNIFCRGLVVIIRIRLEGLVEMVVEK